MFSLSNLLTVLVLVAVATEGRVVPSLRSRTANDSSACLQNAPPANAKAIYMQTNKSPNSVVALTVGSDGRLTSGRLHLTGGNGGNTVDANNTANLGDALSSQGSVEVLGHHLFVVNAGSNSVSMFAIDRQDPSSLTLVGKPANTGGDFPTSLSPSKKLKMVCVAHSGTKAGVSCASFDKTNGIGKFDTLRPFDLKQTNPPSGPLNGIGQTFFTEDSSALITTVKGDPTKKNTGFISIIAASPFMQGMVSQTDAHNSPPGTAVLFGAAQVPGTTQILVTDASFGFAMVDLMNTTAAPMSMTNVTDQKATCWAKISPANSKMGFVTDVAVNHLISVDVTTGKQIQEFQSSNGNAGMIDFVAAGTMVYALSPGKSNDGTGAHVAAFNVAQDGTMTDFENVALDGVDGNAQGMAVLV